MSDLVAEYLKAGSMGLVAATALVALIAVARLFLKRNDAYIAATAALHERYDKALTEQREHHTAAMTEQHERHLDAIQAQHEACVAATKALHERFATDLHEVEKANRVELQTLLEEFIEAAKSDREDYRKIIERTTSVLETFLSRYDRRVR